MASKEATDAYPSPPPSPGKRKVDPILRNALRYTISKEEYEILIKYLRTRAPRAIQRRTSSLRTYSSLVRNVDDYNGATIRASLRVFIVTQAGLKIWDLIATHVLAKARQAK